MRTRVEKNLARIIAERGLTDKEVSEGSGVTVFRIRWGILEGRHGWRLKEQDLQKVCAFLRVDPMQLKNG